jgi:hypothetical protein
MRSGRIQFLALALGCLTLTGPAFADNVPKPADTDETFVTGLRRIGVMAGQVVECTADAEKPAKIDEAMELANQIAIHFGLRAAFNYAGAVGYGSGHAFDKANCTQSIDGWKAIQAKYLNK